MKLFILIVLHGMAAPGLAGAQGTVADYQRAMGLREKVQGLAVNAPEPATWVEKTPRFWYRKSVKGGNEFVLVDASSPQKRPAFDHEKIAASLTAVIKPEKPYTRELEEKLVAVIRKADAARAPAHIAGSITSRM